MPLTKDIWGSYDVIISKTKKSKNSRTVFQSVENTSKRGPLMPYLAPILMELYLILGYSSNWGRKYFRGLFLLPSPTRRPWSIYIPEPQYLEHNGGLAASCLLIAESDHLQSKLFLISTMHALCLGVAIDS